LVIGEVLSIGWLARRHHPDSSAGLGWLANIPNRPITIDQDQGANRQ
jgi:hypothetical protein